MPCHQRLVRHHRRTITGTGATSAYALSSQPRARAPLLDPPRRTVTTADGRTVSGTLAYRDEFNVTLLDADGWTHSYSLSAVKLEVDDPLRAHADQLQSYTDRDMHDVFAYLQTLK